MATVTKIFYKKKVQCAFDVTSDTAYELLNYN